MKIYCNYCGIVKDITCDPFGETFFKHAEGYTGACPSHYPKMAHRSAQILRKCGIEQKIPEFDNKIHVIISTPHKCEVPSSLRCIYNCDECVIVPFRETLKRDVEFIR